MVAYEEVLPDSPPADAPKDEWLQYLRESHGDIEDAKVTALFIFDDEELEAEDIEVVTDEPPTATFT